MDTADVGYSDNEAQCDCPNQLNPFGRGRGSCVAMYLEHLSLLSLKRLTSGEFDRAA
jgi:hypothetical protein